MNDSVRAAISKVMSATSDESGGNWTSDAPSAWKCSMCGCDNPSDVKTCTCGVDRDRPVEKLNATYAKSILGGSDAEVAEIVAVKSLGGDRIFHYSMLWGDPNKTDLESEYFTQATDFWDPFFESKSRALTWDHNMDQTMRGPVIVGKTVDFGNDSIGRWTISQLDRSHQYNRAIRALIEAGAVGSSSDSVPQYVERVQTGKSHWLKTWPWLATALTVEPCEPRMVDTVDYFKSIGINLPNPEALSNKARAMRLKARRVFNT